MPLLAPGLVRNSAVSSKSPYRRSVTMSPFPGGAPAEGLTADRTPFPIDQCSFGKSVAFRSRQPHVVSPSHRSRQPAPRSASRERVRREARLHRRELLQADGPPLDDEAGLLRLVDLEADEAGAGHAVDEVGHRHVVDPGAEAVACGLHAVAVPLADPEGLPRDGVVLRAGEPPAPLLVVDAPAPGALGGVDLDLVAVNDPVPVVGARGAPELHAGVERRVHPDLELEDEVGVLLRRAQEAVLLAEHGAAHEGAVLDGVDGLAPALDPARRALSVEQRDPAFVGLGCHGCQQCQQDGEASAERLQSTDHEGSPGVILTHGVRS